MMPNGEDSIHTDLFASLPLAAYHRYFARWYVYYSAEIGIKHFYFDRISGVTGDTDSLKKYFYPDNFSSVIKCHLNFR